MDTCILLRTAFVKDNTMYVQAGVGRGGRFRPRGRVPTRAC